MAGPSKDRRDPLVASAGRLRARQSASLGAAACLPCYPRPDSGVVLAPAPAYRCAIEGISLVPVRQRPEYTATTRGSADLSSSVE